ncbi:hypothetical protein [Neobacillus soli]|uniref:hypothetical protein n=1 Tax=Neobacillus soli TaxID=220688 RepID=UPI0008269439|nr:hypothetical protein [Neobacillus soli]
MEQIKQVYNLAIKYIHAERFEDAALFLEPLVKEYPSFTEAKWALGLLQVLLGFPYKALQLWKNIDDANLLSYKQMVEEKLPQYDELYENYNQALKLIQAEEIHQAKTIFHELLSFQKEVPLPVDFYYGNLLAQLLTGEVERASQEINSSPLYVINSSVIRDLEKTINLHQSNQPAFLEKAVVQDLPNKVWSKGFFIGSGMTASLLIGALGMWIFGGAKEVYRAEPVIQQNAGDSGIDTEKSKDLKKEFSVPQEVKTNVKAKQRELDDMIHNDDIDKSNLSVKTGLNIYRNGLTAFRNKDYRKAAVLMEKSLTLQSSEYFSDDAFFFLIKSKERLNEKENLLPLYDRFLSQPSKHFVHSPYMDDLLLDKAKLWIEIGNAKDALPLLEEILTKYKQEWTAVEAAKIFKQITEVQK